MTKQHDKDVDNTKALVNIPKSLETIQAESSNKIVHDIVSS